MPPSPRLPTNTASIRRSVTRRDMTARRLTISSIIPPLGRLSMTLMPQAGMRSLIRAVPIQQLDGDRRLVLGGQPRRAMLHHLAHTTAERVAIGLHPGFQREGERGFIPASAPQRIGRDRRSLAALGQIVAAHQEAVGPAAADEVAVGMAGPAM